MPKTDWTQRFSNWFNWYNSGAGPYFNHGDATRPYYIKNYNYASNTAYASDPSKMVTLTEGQSYGLWYALMADNLPAFLAVFNVMQLNHKLSAQNISTSKSAQGNPWSQELADFTNNLGVSLLDDRGLNPSLEVYGWVWSQDYDGTTGGDQSGLASDYLAPDGDLVFVACLLMAYERWSLRGFLTQAQKILADFAQYGVRKCGGRYALTMGQYRYGGGFTLPAPQFLNLSAGTVFPGSDQVIFNDVDFTTGDAVRIYNTGGAVAPGGLALQDTIGAVWPKYYVRVNGSFNFSFYHTKADAVAGTNIIDITSTGSGNVYIIPYETQRGQVATNPSYLHPPFFRLFAKYDTTNAAIWNQLASSAYVDISDTCTRNYWNMPAYLQGINIADGSRSLFRSGGDSASHQLDAIRVAVNMAFDGTSDALTTLKTQCQFNSTTNLWEPKAGAQGGIWRYFVDTGFIPSTMDAKASQVYTPLSINISTNQIDFGVTGLQGMPMHADGTTPPFNFLAAATYYPRYVSGTSYTMHLSAADATSGANVFDIQTAGTAPLFTVGHLFLSANVNITTDVITLSDTITWKTGDPVVYSRDTGATSPGGLPSGTTFYARLLSLNTLTLHTTSAGAIANTGKVDITSVGGGTGIFMLSTQVANVGWYYRGGTNALDTFSPYGAAQIMAYKYSLNGYADAEAFYNALPTWVKQQDNGSYIENNGDYYPQHAIGLITGVMGGNAQDKYNGRSYLTFSGSTAQATAASALEEIRAKLAVPAYGVLLTDGNGLFIVPVIGPRAWDALSSDQKSATIKLTGNWRPVG